MALLLSPNSSPNSAGAFPRRNSHGFREHRQIIEPKAEEIHAKHNLPERVLPEQNKEADRCRENDPACKLGEDDAAAKKRDIDRGKFSKIDGHANVVRSNRALHPSRLGPPEPISSADALPGTTGPCRAPASMS